MERKLLALASIFVLFVTVAAQCGTPTAIFTPTAIAQGEGMELTVYNQNLALVKDKRTLTFQQGVNEVRFTDVAAQIDPTSVHFASLTDPTGTTVLEQNYEYDIVGASKLLQKYVDQDVSLVTKDGTLYKGKLLSGAADIILAAPDGQITVVKLDNVREFKFPNLPSGLITKPSLVWQVQSAKGGQQSTEVTYLTHGINWEANYVVVAAADDKSMGLTGWVTIDNQSGATYNDAKLKLIAGEIHRVEKAAYPAEERVPAAAPTAAPQFVEKAFFEYHMYTLQRPATIRDNETKQIEFVSASEVPIEKIFVYDGALMRYYGYGPITTPSYGTPTNTKVDVMIEFMNSEKQGMGMPLPKGTVRVYKQDPAGGTEFIGEDSIDHTPKDERVRLTLGTAFDVVGERKQTDFKQLGENSIEESFEIKLRNHKAEPVEVRVIEHLYRWSEWEITKSSQDYKKLDAQTIEFRVQVPKDGETTVTYTVRYRW
jgi:hypothetical protein